MIYLERIWRSIMIKNNARIIFGILTLAVLTVGMTFAFFTAFIKSDEDMQESYSIF